MSKPATVDRSVVGDTPTAADNWHPGRLNTDDDAPVLRRLPAPDVAASVPPKRLLPEAGEYNPSPRFDPSDVPDETAYLARLPDEERNTAPLFVPIEEPETTILGDALNRNDYEVIGESTTNPVDDFAPLSAPYSANHGSAAADDLLTLDESSGPRWAPPGETAPHNLLGWWDSAVTQPSRNACGGRALTINELISSALQHSSEIRVISDTPLVRDTAIIEAAAGFDWAGFVEANWTDVNEPVGSTLTTGGPSRFSNQLMQYEFGLRRQTSTGGRFEVGQRYGWERSNSVFFIPNDQGTSRLTLNYTQPILRGAGKIYNNSLILLAQVESGIARDEFSRELQGFLLDVTQAYWSLYLERASYLQRKRLLDRGEVILEKLEARQATDAVTNQVVRARAAVASRRSDLFRAAAAVKNAEGRIRALVNDPSLGCLDELELMPLDAPCTHEVPLCLPDVIKTAIHNRPEVHAALKQIKASGVRMNMTKNELLPALDVVLETYVAGLRGQDGIGVAWTDQFSAGSPTYSAGIQLEVPLRNREAKARFLRRALELRQFQSQFRSTLNALQLEVEVAVREAQTAYQEVTTKHEAMVASQSEVSFIEERWAYLPGDDRSAALYLEDLLAAQERLVASEFEFANAKVTYNLALTDLKRASGTLLQCEQIQVHKSEDRGIPSLHLTKTGIDMGYGGGRNVPASAWAPMTEPDYSHGSYPPPTSDSPGLADPNGIFSPAATDPSVNDLPTTQIDAEGGWPSSGSRPPTGPPPSSARFSPGPGAWPPSTPSAPNLFQPAPFQPAPFRPAPFRPAVAADFNPN